MREVARAIGADSRIGGKFLQHRISRLVVNRLCGTVTGKRIGVLGFAFKANTNDTRESTAIPICKDLLEEGAVLQIIDPRVSERQMALDLTRR